MKYLFVCMTFLLVGCGGADSQQEAAPLAEGAREPAYMDTTPGGIKVYANTLIRMDKQAFYDRLDRLYSEVQECMGVHTSIMPTYYYIDSSLDFGQSGRGFYVYNSKSAYVESSQPFEVEVTRHEFIHHIDYVTGVSFENNYNHIGDQWNCQYESFSTILTLRNVSQGKGTRQ